MIIQQETFGVTREGKPVEAYRLENKAGEYLRIITFGGAMQALCLKDRDGVLCDVVPGFEQVEDYEKSLSCFGSMVGRVCNRTAGAQFVLHGKTYHLGRNDNGNNLHSGPDGYHLRVWEYESSHCDEKEASVTLKLHSPDGDQGFPGSADIHVTYAFNESDQVHVSIRAVPDRDTMLNMTCHSYFNLNGEGSGKVTDHLVTIHADTYLEKDSENIPVERRSVTDTIYDFRKGKKIGKDLPDTGFDHCFYVDEQPCFEACSEKTGIGFTLSTDQPCVQLYTAGFLEEPHGKHPYSHTDAFAIEAQYPVNSVNGVQNERPLVKAQEEYRWDTVYQFYRR